MPVDRVVERRQIVQENLNLVAFPHMEQWGRNLPAESESLEGLIADQRNARLFDIHLELMFGGTRYSFPTDWGIALRGRIRCRSGQRRNRDGRPQTRRSDEHTSELQSLMRTS